MVRRPWSACGPVGGPVGVLLRPDRRAGVCERPGLGGWYLAGSRGSAADRCETSVGGWGDRVRAFRRCLVVDRRCGDGALPLDAGGQPGWTLAGSPVPFVPLAWGGYVRDTPPRFRPLYEQSYAQSPARVEAAGIPVEQIQQLVLVAGGDDQVWPSSESAHRISARRRRAGLETTVVTRADAGHRTILPGETVLTGGQAMQRGGSEHADRALGRAAWAAIRLTVAR
ncbi:acyl-CoA thioester hydrolase/BAAT C-terminal domain-containing protein [Curtobacterium sp. PhB172]|uniref:acyl-CoA thioester hydrolase/BAAT C-terminal domain-containing protein n=1 Tax=Curtobacterium sp. PhB172 TaxID=2485196 RepID=UPI0037BF11A6